MSGSVLFVFFVTDLVSNVGRMDSAVAEKQLQVRSQTQAGSSILTWDVIRQQVIPTDGRKSSSRYGMMHAERKAVPALREAGAGTAFCKLYGEEKSDSVEEIRIQNDNLLAVHCDDALFLHAGQLSGESAAIRVEKARELGFREREFPDAVFLLGQGREVEL